MEGHSEDAMGCLIFLNIIFWTLHLYYLMNITIKSFSINYQPSTTNKRINFCHTENIEKDYYR